MRWIAVGLLGVWSVVLGAQQRSVAITVDDLVCISCAPVVDGKPDAAAMEASNRKLTDALKRARIPVTGFVITKTVEDFGGAGQRALTMWLDAGFDLGSHTYSHPNFADLTEAQEEAEIARADAFMRPLVEARGRKLEFLRFPYNDTGDTQAKHDAIQVYLKAHGYTMAASTIDTTDYEFAAAYLRAKTLNDAAMAERIRKAYLDYSAEEIDFYAKLNTKVLGYEPAEVLVIHDTLLNADTIDDVLALFRARGYRFVSLGEAQSDSAYAIADTYVTKYGPMWGYRWAVDKKMGKLGLHENESPQWIDDYIDGKPVQ